MKVVLDTNVLLAAFAFGGISRAIVDVCIQSHDIILSEHILTEVHRNLREKFNHTQAMADDRIKTLREMATIVSPSEVPSNACRDSTDLAVLGTVVASRSDCLVTGDKDLLILGNFDGCTIKTPRQFWQSLGQD